MLAFVIALERRNKRKDGTHMSSRSATRRKRQEAAKRRTAAARREQRRAVQANRFRDDASMNAMRTAGGQSSASNGNGSDKAVEPKNGDGGAVLTPKTGVAGRKATMTGTGVEPIPAYAPPKDGKPRNAVDMKWMKLADSARHYQARKANARKNAVDEHELAVERQHEHDIRRRKHRRVLGIVVGTVCAASMIIPIGAASIAAIMNPYNPNTQTSTTGSSTTGSTTTDVTKMTEDERRQLVEQYPSLVSNDTEKQEFIKTGRLPASITDSQSNATGKDGGNANNASNGKTANDGGAKATTNGNGSAK